MALRNVLGQRSIMMDKNPRNRRHFIKLGLLSGGATFLGWKLHAAQKSDDALALYRPQMEKIRPLFMKKREPDIDDWLAQHNEAGQTFEQYLKINPNRPTAERTRIYLQAIGTFTKKQTEVIYSVQNFMQIVFGLEVKMLPTQGIDKIPANAQRGDASKGNRQLLSTHILHQILKPNRPKDAVAVLAITNEDLWPGDGWNFVFGQASLGERVGVWSTARMGDPEKEPKLFLRRVLQVAVHETGHMFGIKHCTAYECCMNGSNHLAESDRAPLVFCPECDAKLWWACSLTPSKRAKALHTFAKEHGLDPDTAQWEKVAKALESQP
jgi:archaemetzincin